MSDSAENTLIRTLQDSVERLQNQNTKLRTEQKERREASLKLVEEVAAHARLVESLTKERDTLKSTLEAKPHELQTEVDRLKGEVRSRDHKDKFRTLAKAKGVTSDKAQDDLWQLMGYQPESDEVDEPRLTAALDSSLQGRDWFRAASAPDGATSAADAAPKAGRTTSPSQIPAGPGAHRGTASGKSSQSYDEYLAEKYPNPGRLA